MYNGPSGREFAAFFKNQGRGAGGMPEVTANTPCNSSLDHLQLVLQVFLVGVPQRGGVLQDWAYSALVALCLNCDGTPFQVLVSEHAGPVHFGCDSIDIESPVNVFCQLHPMVFSTFPKP